jgi:hypothetical protein
MFNFFSIQLSNFHDTDSGFDELTWFDRLAHNQGYCVWYYSQTHLNLSHASLMLLLIL